MKLRSGPLDLVNRGEDIVTQLLINQVACGGFIEIDLTGGALMAYHE